ncbi:D-beta-D-heptose 7-phosphate kinase / D-beta-D-heptose 1-phosphate adenosyltransferase [Desulfocicer vacuolatum DSM 3385]|uniref:D-glycero-beta-D-manno-heptose 1-phosphate adenylyltransferase n=1 Tax=Desulfocicer vacuolatum DSM 3385 TaxID=1121400 RepID=A0A1W1Z800_9BACT|nr:D-glycero-beta-D-manno-heptose 1-phosphate adenylyltransferase [Desulfocicer vacuolatum]SMC44504.1 D-beta-D-heptose 7-phosphate kinase / D-beta-D-heptose 1-phosphate adenosyltransferase [Desulfocicer vacuolatum DSM 3385]
MGLSIDQLKIIERQAVADLGKTLRDRGRTIVFTNGCFDILHAGHVSYLQAAAHQGDVLVLGLNSDASVSRIKGPSRPVISQEHRSRVMAALACVDHVVIFDEPDPGELIRELNPHVLVKGADWAEADIIGADTVTQNGGRVARMVLEPDISTTIIIERIVARFS